MFDFDRIKQPFAIVLCGPPGSGKTTARKALLALLPKDTDPVVLSTDDNILRAIQKAGQGETYDEAFGKYINQASRDYEEAFGAYTFYQKNLIIDRTHVNPGSRARTLSKLSGYYVIAINMPILPDYELAERIKLRNDQHVDFDIVQRMAHTYTPATLAEGFNEVVNY